MIFKIYYAGNDLWNTLCRKWYFKYTMQETILKYTMEEMIFEDHYAGSDL